MSYIQFFSEIYEVVLKIHVFNIFLLSSSRETMATCRFLEAPMYPLSILGKKLLSKYHSNLAPSLLPPLPFSHCQANARTITNRRLDIVLELNIWVEKNFDKLSLIRMLRVFYSIPLLVHFQKVTTY